MTDMKHADALTPDHSHPTLSRMTIRPAPHELGAYLHWKDGLAPMHDLRDCLGITPDTDTDADAENIPPIETTFATDGGENNGDGEPWHVTLRAKRSGINPEQVNPDLASIYEPVISVERIDYEGRAPPKATYQVRPRTPDTVGPRWTGVDVDTKGSNIPPVDYPPLLHAATRALGIDPAHFDPADLAGSSNITVLEHYVRVRREDAHALHGDDGPIRRISQLLATTGHYRRVEDDATNPRSYYGTVGFDDDGARTLINGHRLGKTIKLYDAATPPEDPADPLYHPKLCVRFERGQTTDKVYWDSLSNVQYELTELLVNLFRWSGITPCLVTGHDRRSHYHGSFVGDEHFSEFDILASADYDLPRQITDPLPRIERTQQNSVRVAFEDATPAQRNVLGVLADGGHVTDPTGKGLHYSVLAERADCSVATVYRVLDNLGDLARNTAGRIWMASHKVAESIRSRFSRSRPERDTTDTDIDTDTAAGDTDIRSDDEPARSDTPEPDPWVAWSAEHGVLKRRDNKTIAEKGHRRGRAQWCVFDLGELPPRWTGSDLQDHVNDGLAVWAASGRPERTYQGGRFVWRECGDDEIQETVGMKMPSLSPDQRRVSRLKSQRR